MSSSVRFRVFGSKSDVFTRRFAPKVQNEPELDKRKSASSTKYPVDPTFCVVSESGLRNVIYPCNREPLLNVVKSVPVCDSLLQSATLPSVSSRCAHRCAASSCRRSVGSPSWPVKSVAVRSYTTVCVCIQGYHTRTKGGGKSFWEEGSKNFRKRSEQKKTPVLGGVAKKVL